MDNLALRKASADDSDFAYSVKKAAFQEYAEKVWGWDEDEQRRLHRQRFEAQDVRIINLTGVDIGFLSVVEMPDCLKLNQIFILPEYQGRGIGSECTRMLMGEARRLGLSARLRVLKANPRARTLFERLGFVHTGETDTHDLLEWAPNQ